jgi:hypothetical protein
MLLSVTRPHGGNAQPPDVQDGGGGLIAESTREARLTVYMYDMSSLSAAELGSIFLEKVHFKISE